MGELSESAINSFGTSPKGGTARELGGCEGGSATQKGTEHAGVVVWKSLEDRRERVCQETGEAVGHAPVIPDRTTTMGDEVWEGAQRGALWIALLQRVAQGEPQWGVGRGIVGSAGGKATRYRATVSGWSGKSPRKSSVRTAQSRGPWWR